MTTYATNPARMLDKMIALDRCAIKARIAMAQFPDPKAMATCRIVLAMLEVELPPLRLNGMSTRGIEEVIEEGVRRLDEAAAAVI